MNDKALVFKKGSNHGAQGIFAVQAKYNLPNFEFFEKFVQKFVGLTLSKNMRIDLLPC